ncbi:MAG: LytTR family DNA-binding domain-containing protein [Bacteroidota bacterium]
MWNAIIIEDQVAAEQHLRNLIQQHCPNIQVVGTASTVVQGAKLWREQRPDLLFLDIELPDGTGFDLLDILGDQVKNVIFTTGLDDQAIRAFRYAAIDYLLKPIDAELLRAAVERIRKTTRTPSEQHQLLQSMYRHTDQLPTRIAVHAQDRIQLVEIADILRLEAESNYTTFHLVGNKRIVVGKTLKNFAELLDAHQFLRVHQSHVVNPSAIKAFIKTDGGYLLLTNESKVPVSVRRRQLLMDFLQGPFPGK